MPPEAMRVLVTGASGFIGRAVADALAARGHRVVRASRHAAGADAIAVDLAAVPSREWWLPRLEGIDAVVNAVGILREHGAQTFEALHARAPIELFHAAASAGVRSVVQVSALGADDRARSGYQLSKKAADDVLRSLPLRAAIVQPSLVYGDGGASAALFDAMAVAPLLPLPGGGRMRVQPVHVEDIVAGIVALVESPPATPTTLAMAGPRPLALRDYLQELRGALGEPGPLRVLPVPEPVFRATAWVAGLFPASALDGDTAAMLLAGNSTDANALADPRPVAAFIPHEQAESQRRRAVLALWTPVLRVALALLWIWTAVVSFGLYPVAGSYALLAQVGLEGAAATIALYGAATLDLALGLLTLAAPARWRRALWLVQIALIAGYTLLISVFLPAFWLHPYGPVSKNLPIVAALALLWALERPRSR